MKMKSSIQNKIILLILVGILFSSLTIGGLGIASFCAELEKSVVSTMNLTCQEKAEELNGVLGRIEQSTEVMAVLAVNYIQSVEALKEDAFRAECIAHLTSFTGSSYSVAMTASRSGRQVYCLVTDQYGSKVKTDIVTLTITKTPLAILSQPESVEVKSGETALVEVEAQGDGLKYAWYYKNAGGSSYTKTSTYKSNDYSITMNASRSGRYVYCKVTDKYGNTVKSKTVSLKMAEPVTITQQPKSVRVAEGETASVTVTAKGDGLTYEWYYRNPDSTKYVKTTSFKGNTYSVTMNESRDGRYVYCKITDKYGKTVKSNTASLRMMTPLEITRQPEDAMVGPDETAEVTLEAKGEAGNHQICKPYFTSDITFHLPCPYRIMQTAPVISQVSPVVNHTAQYPNTGSFTRIMENPTLPITSTRPLTNANLESPAPFRTLRAT